MHCAATDPRIGTITPFSNNAEICSFPRFCENNPWPAGADPEPVRAALAAAAVPTYPDLPTGVGFCFYVRRALLDDDRRLRPGVRRGLRRGERPLPARGARRAGATCSADNAFVVHTGGRSFAGQKAELGARNMALLLERHPHYLDMVRDVHRRRSAAAAARGRARCARGRRGAGARRAARHPRPRRRHRDARARADRGIARALARTTSPSRSATRWQVEEHRADGTVRHVRLRARARDEPLARRSSAASARSFGIALIHLHNISALPRRHPDRAGRSCRVPYGYTVHDLNFACPTITFLARRRHVLRRRDRRRRVCRAASPRSRAFAGVDIVRWRDAPSRRCSQRASFRDRAVALGRRHARALLPGAPGRRHRARRRRDASCRRARPARARRSCCPTTTCRRSRCSARSVPTRARAASSGWCELARARGARVRFVLIGYIDVQHGPWQSRRRGLHRARPLRRRATCRDLLAHYRVALVAVSVGGPGDVQLHAVRGLGGGTPGAGAADRRARRARAATAAPAGS